MGIKKIFTLNLMLFSLNAFSQEIYLNSVVILDPQNTINSSDLMTKNKYKYSLEGLKLPLNERLSNKIFQTDLKVMIFQGLNHVVFTDGSMMVKYSEYFDFNSYASENNLEVTKTFKDLDYVVLKTKDISNLKNILRDIKNQNGVISAKIDFIDPNFIPH